MNVLLVAAEANPFIKSGGLGDVVGALPKAFREKGVEARVVIQKCIVEFLNIIIME